MKVCAHINTGPFQNGHMRCDTIAEAVVAFRIDLWFLDADHGTMDLYPQCSDCDWSMNFHDYPMARFELGPRGGIRRVIV